MSLHLENSAMHFGQTLRKLIDQSPFQDKDFCERAGVSLDTLYRHLREEVPAGKKATYRAFAEALEMTPQQLDAAWKGVDADAASPAHTQPQEKKFMNLADIRDLAQLSADELDMWLAAANQRRRQLRAVQNKSPLKSARSASA